MAYNSDLTDDESLWIAFAIHLLLCSNEITHPVLVVIFDQSV